MRYHKVGVTNGSTRKARRAKKPSGVARGPEREAGQGSSRLSDLSKVRGC